MAKIAKKKVATIEARVERVKDWKAEAEKLYNARLESGKASAFLPFPHVTTHDTGHKLSGIQSISTSMRLNPVCTARIEKALCEYDFSCICLSCYADRLIGAYGLEDKGLGYNLYLLACTELTDEQATLTPISALYSRVESFGDVANTLHAENYIRIIRNHSLQHFGIWSKNAGFWASAFDHMGKPENCTFVYSSPTLDKVEDVPDCIKAYCDHVFTVCSTQEVYERLVIEYGNKCAMCAGIACIAECGCKCYRKNTPFYIFELKR